jgi:hypothetical protein
VTLRDRIIQTPVKRNEKLYHWDAFDSDVLIVEPSTKIIEDLASETVDIEHKRVRPNYTAMKIIACVYDPESRKPLFTKADRQYISELPSSITAPLSSEIETICGPSNKDISDAEKNLETTEC